MRLSCEVSRYFFVARRPWFMGCARVRPMGALLAIPLTLAVKEILPILVGEPLSPLPARP